MSERESREQELLHWRDLFGRLKLLLPLLFLVYVGFALHTSWVTGGKGNIVKTDPAIKVRMDALNCTPELKKHVIPSAKKLPNPWLLETKEEGGLYLDALKEKPECLGLIMMWLLPSGKQGHTDYVTYYYDRTTNQPAIKITVEYLK